MSSLPAVKSAALARDIVWRVLRTATFPLARAEFVVTREFWDLTIGDVFAWTNPDFGFVKFPMRVTRIDYGRLEQKIAARDREMDNAFAKDAQIIAIRGARKYRGDRLIRTAKPHKILDPAHSPLIAVRLNILTRKTLGGLHTNLDSQVLDAGGEPIPGLYAAGEVGAASVG